MAEEIKGTNELYSAGHVYDQLRKRCYGSSIGDKAQEIPVDARLKGKEKSSENVEDGNNTVHDDGCNKCAVKVFLYDCFWRRIH